MSASEGCRSHDWIGNPQSPLATAPLGKGASIEKPEEHFPYLFLERKKVATTANDDEEVMN